MIYKVLDFVCIDEISIPIVFGMHCYGRKEWKILDIDSDEFVATIFYKGSYRHDRKSCCCGSLP